MLLACGSADSSEASTEETVATSSTEATQVLSGGGGSEDGTEGGISTPTAAIEAGLSTDGTVVNSSANGQLADVVLVQSNDVLNFRFGPGVNFAIAGNFPPTATNLSLTNVTDVVDGSIWVFIEGAGWVNSFFLTSSTSSEEFASDLDAQDLIFNLAGVFESRGNLTQITSWRGLHLGQLGDVDKIRSSEVPNLLTDPTALYWGQCQEGECNAGTFAEQVGDAYLSTIYDDGVRVLTNTLIPGPNGAASETIIPEEFQNFHFIAIHDPGDNPDFDGLDWMTWYVFIELTPDGPQVVGLLLDQWQP